MQRRDDARMKKPATAPASAAGAPGRVVVRRHARRPGSHCSRRAAFAAPAWRPRHRAARADPARGRRSNRGIRRLPRLVPGLRRDAASSCASEPACIAPHRSTASGIRRSRPVVSCARGRQQLPRSSLLVGPRPRLAPGNGGNVLLIMAAGASATARRSAVTRAGSAACASSRNRRLAANTWYRVTYPFGQFELRGRRRGHQSTRRRRLLPIRAARAATPVLQRTRRQPGRPALPAVGRTARV